MEEFFKSHQYTIGALGVLGTFFAVTVALFNSLLAARASRTKIRARASINVIYHSTLKGSELPKYLVVSVRNIGIMPVHIQAGFFHWRLPFEKEVYEVLPLDIAAGDPWASQKKYPVEIKPRSSDTFFLSDINGFREYSRKYLVGGSFCRRVRSRFLSAVVFTDESKVFNVVLDRSLRKQLVELRT